MVSSSHGSSCERPVYDTAAFADSYFKATKELGKPLDPDLGPRDKQDMIQSRVKQGPPKRSHQCVDCKSMFLEREVLIDQEGLCERCFDCAADLIEGRGAVLTARQAYKKASRKDRHKIRARMRKNLIKQLQCEEWYYNKNALVLQIFVAMLASRGDNRSEGAVPCCLFCI